MKILLGRKEYMTQLFSENGKRKPVTILHAGPVVVTQVKRSVQNGYDAVQVGFDRQKANRITKAEHGHAKPALEAVGEDAATVGFRHLKEFRSAGDNPLAVGDTIDVSTFEIGDRVMVTSRSKGKGFQGGVKRHGFSGKNASHGTKHAHREVGSVGATGPQRIFKGRKMPGRMGYNQVTVKNLEVAYIDPERNLIALHGAVPGRNGDIVQIRGDS